jgi:hypothetical protein
MKKYISVLFLLTFIIPSIAFASWWNPFTWKIFQKEQVSQVQVEKTLEEKIVEPTSTSPATSPVEETTEPVTNTKTKPTTVISTPTLPVQIVDVCLNIEGIQSQVPTGYSSISSICTLLEVKDYCPNITGVQSEIPEGKVFYKNTGECLTLKEIDAIEEKSDTPDEESDKTTLSVEKITCIERPAGTYYLLPFSVKGKWVSGWVQVRISDGNGGTAIKGLDLDISNVGDGFIFSKDGTVRTLATGGLTSGDSTRSKIELDAGLNATYQIRIHSVVPTYNRLGIRSYSSSSLIAEESGKFTLPNCN